MAEEKDSGGFDGPLDGGEPEEGDPEEMTVAEHEALAAVQQSQARLKAIRQARGYYKRNKQTAGGDSAAKSRLGKLMAENPCRACGGCGHWSKDAACPMNKAKAASQANVTVNTKDTPSSAGGGIQASPATSYAQAPSSAAAAAPTHAAMTAVLDSFLDRQKSSQVAGAYMVASDIVAAEHVQPIDIGLEAYVAKQPRLHDYEGVMIVDIGCVRSVAGSAWVEREIAFRRHLGKHVFVERTADWFRFGDGVKRLSEYRVHLEVSIKGHVGLIPIDVIDYPCPPLLSKAVCNALGMCIDCESNTCEIRKVGERKCPLLVSPEGHYLLRINDWFPRNPTWHALVHEQSKRPKIDSEDVRMFEIRNCQAVGKGSRSRLRRQALQALLSRSDHGQSPPTQSCGPIQFLPGACNPFGSRRSPRGRSECSELGGGTGGGLGAGDGADGCDGNSQCQGCTHDLYPAQDPRPAIDAGGTTTSAGQAQGKGAQSQGVSTRGGSASAIGQSQYQEHQEGRATCCNDGGACRFSSAGHDQVMGSSHEHIMGPASAVDHTQVEGHGLAPPHSPGLHEQPGAMETESSLVGQPLCDRDGRDLGASGVMRQEPSRPKGTSDVPLKFSCRQAFQRGHIQRLKRGIAYALHGQALLRDMPKHNPERKFCVLEVFGTSVSLQAIHSQAWTAFEPADLSCGTDLEMHQEQERVLKQIVTLDPDLVVITPPCGPWSCLQAINDQDVVMWKRLMSFHLWEFTRKVWDLQTSRGKLCLTEQPWLSKALELKVMAERPHLHRAIVDQCQFELRDPENQKPMRKRTVLDANSATFAWFLEQNARCTHRTEDHQVIEGGTWIDGRWVNRSLVAGLWTPAFSQHIMDAAEATLLATPVQSSRAAFWVSESDEEWQPSNSCQTCAKNQSNVTCGYCLETSCDQCLHHHQCSFLLSHQQEPFDEPCDSHLACAVEVEPPEDMLVGDADHLSEAAIRKEFKRLQEEEDQRKGDFGGIGSRYGKDHPCVCLETFGTRSLSCMVILDIRAMNDWLARCRSMAHTRASLKGPRT